MKTPPTLVARSDSPLLNTALRLLVHPLSLLALAVLLVNDHVLRVHWPSALTGKLGDFAWLFFIPFALIALLALLLPRRASTHSGLVAAAGYTFVALTFSLAKTLPAGHDLIVDLVSRAFGFRVGWRLDPTDLVALVSLGGSALLWTKARHSASQPGCGTGNRPSPGPAGWIALAAAALLTVANSPAPDPGIFCLDDRGGEVDAYAGYSTYRSTDGGLTWESMPNQPRGACANPWSNASGPALTTVDPNDQRRQYRITPGESIEYSEDEGTTWRVVYKIPQVNAATAAAERKRLSSYAMVRPVPLDGRVDRTTRNAIFAMGQSGVLVQEARSGAWREVAVGTYRPAEVSSLGDYVSLLLGEILLGLAVAVLAFCTLTTRLLVRGKALWLLGLVVAWLLWAVAVFLFPPAITDGYGAILTYGAMLVLAVILLVMFIIALVGSLQHAREAGRTVLERRIVAALAAGVLFLLPYALWAAGALTQYVMAGIFGTLLAAAVILAGDRWSRAPQDLPR